MRQCAAMLCYSDTTATHAIIIMALATLIHNSFSMPMTFANRKLRIFRSHVAFVRVRQFVAIYRMFIRNGVECIKFVSLCFLNFWLAGQNMHSNTAVYSFEVIYGHSYACISLADLTQEGKDRTNKFEAICTIEARAGGEKSGNKWTCFLLFSMQFLLRCYIRFVFSTVAYTQMAIIIFRAFFIFIPFPFASLCHYLVSALSL